MTRAYRPPPQYQVFVESTHRPIRIADPARWFSSFRAEAERRMADVLSSGQYVGGPVVREAECHAAAMMGRVDAVGVGSGTDALMLALQAVGARPGTEVIVPAVTFFATAGAVAAIGAHPVVVDVREDGCIDPECAMAARTARTAAVIPVHLFGNQAESPDLDVPIVDDAAHATGSTPPCAAGVLTATSTYPTKTWGGAGDGGFISGDDPTLMARIRALGHHGIIGPHLHDRIDGVMGRNSRLDAIHAAYLLASLTTLQARINTRRSHAERYDLDLPEWLARHPRDPGSPVPYYMVRTSRRDHVRQTLADEGIETAVYYPRPLSAQPALTDEKCFPTPIADALCAELLAIPVHSALDDRDIERVICAVRSSRPSSSTKGIRCPT